MLNKMGLKAKLVAGFALVALICLIVGGVGIFGLKKGEHNVQDLGMIFIPRIKSLEKINITIEAMAHRCSLLANPFITLEERKKLSNLVEEFKTLDDTIKIYSPLISTKAELELWPTLAPKFGEWKKKVEAFLAMSKEMEKLLEAGARLDDPQLKELEGKLWHASTNIREEMETMDVNVEKLVDSNDVESEKEAKESLEDMEHGIILMAAFIVIGVVLSIILGFVIASRIASAVMEVTTAAKEMANGNYAIEVTYKSGDEVGQCAEACRAMIAQMNNALTDVNRAVVQVAAGSNQISQASQSLSSGATESAASLEEITASITQIGAQAKSNAENSTQSSNLANNVRGAAEKGNTEMADMLKAIQQVCEDGQKIAKVVKMIDDIAFQTNVLSLNAAVEAARAGKHGRGFTVVADAVRSLANESATAAKETAALVEGTIKRMDGSLAIAERTAESLREIVSNSVKASDLISEIAASSNEQAQGVNQIGQGLTQLNQVIQQNSSNSEESAATAEELSGQAEELRRLVSMFRLKDNGGQGAVYMQSDSGDGHGKKALQGHDNRRAVTAAPKSAGYLPDKGKKAEAGEYISLGDEADRY